MARKTKEISITAEGRDKGKRFFLTEMSAAAAERWARKALAGINVRYPGAFQAVAQNGASALAGTDPLNLLECIPEELFDEAMKCVQIIDNGGKRTLRQWTDQQRELENALRRAYPDGNPYKGTEVDDDIEDVATITLLRAELWNLHMDFSGAASPSN